jgi:hypothetical protein
LAKQIITLYHAGQKLITKDQQALGSAWPIIRGHGLLNALHAKVGSVPTVLFYPGEYDGTALKPFGRIESNNYYRAFKLVP